MSGSARRKRPSVPIFYPDWLVLSELSRDIALALVAHAHGRLLDVGCGEKPYAALAPRVTEWVGVDRADNPSADLVGDAYAIPLPDASVETVLCTQVLEHLEDPERALREMRRVLQPGGALIASAPQYWPLHEEPRDFYRYTTLGLRHLIDRAGYELVEHRTQGRGAAVAGQALNNALLILGEEQPFAGALWFKAIKAPAYLAVNLATKVLQGVLRSERDVLNHLVVARRIE